jgi:glutathione S-transferase
MAPLKVTYFDARGRAELIRMCLYFGGIEFEDNRLSHAEFAEKKAKGAFPFCQLPTIEGGDLPCVFCQSIACARYAAKLAGLYPEDPVEALKCDSVIDGCIDILQKVIPAHFEKDEEIKKALLEKLYSATIPAWCACLEKFIVGKYILGDKLCFADIALANSIESLGEDIFVAFPQLKEYMERVHSIPRIAEWIEKRPVTAY